MPVAPPYEAGGSILVLNPLNPQVTPVEGWVYLQGERRVRRAPELQYDTRNRLPVALQNAPAELRNTPVRLFVDKVIVSRSAAIVPFPGRPEEVITLFEHGVPYKTKPGTGSY